MVVVVVVVVDVVVIGNFDSHSKIKRTESLVSFINCYNVHF